jgi:hypothetical protein
MIGGDDAHPILPAKDFLAFMIGLAKKQQMILFRMFKMGRYQ